MSFKVVDLQFNEKFKRWILIIKVEDMLDFCKNDLICKECMKIIDKDDLIYFCHKEKSFYHKSCAIKSKHHLNYCTLKNPEHEDFFVLLDIIELSKTTN